MIAARWTASIAIATSIAAPGPVAVPRPISAGPSVNTQQQPVFRAATDYVRVDVVVTDSNERPIRDLTKDDFEIVEKGRPQTINDFRFVDVPLPPRPIGAPAPSGPPPDVANNAAPSPQSRVFVVVIDDLHLLEQDIIPIKKLLNDFVDALAPDDEVAMVFVSFSNLSLNFTTDRGVIRGRIDRVRDSLGFGADALGRTQSTGLVNDARTPMRYIQAADRVLTNVAQSLAGSTHSRRAIVYLTNGSRIQTRPDPFVPNDYEFIQDAYRAAERADVPIYTIDPRGQVLPADAVRGAIGMIDGPESGINHTAIAAAIRAQQNRLTEIAIATGGRAFIGQSDLTKAIRELVADNGSYYLLGYYPTPFTADGKYHDIDVHVKRPGTRVRARLGYVASSVDALATSAKPLLDTAMSTGVNVSGIQLRAVAAPLAPTRKGVTTSVTLEVSYPPRADGSRQISDDLQMSIVALDPDAKVKATSERALKFSGTAPDQNAITFLIDDAIELPAQQLTLRIGLSSRALGRAGTVQMPLVVPDPGDDTLQIGGLVIGRAGDRTPAMNAALIAALVPFQPATARRFIATDSIRIFGRAFWKGRDSIAVTAGARGSTMASLTSSIADGAKGKEGTFDGAVSLAGLPPGDHVIEVTVKSSSGKTASRLIPITVAAGR